MQPGDSDIFRDRVEAGRSLGIEVAAYLRQNGTAGHPLVMALLGSDLGKAVRVLFDEPEPGQFL